MVQRDNDVPNGAGDVELPGARLDLGHRPPPVGPRGSTVSGQQEYVKVSRSPSLMAPRAVQPLEDSAGFVFDARVGPSCSARSEHRDHRDRSIVIKKIGLVITGIGAS